MHTLEPAAVWSSGWSSRAPSEALLGEHIARSPEALRTVMRVLIVDDDEDIRVLLRNQLERAGYEVAGEAADGGEAIELCEAIEPDAVILDLLMPRVNGFEAIPRLVTKHPRVRIVAYTAVAGEFVREEMRRLGIPLVLKSGQFSRLDAVLRELERGADS
jgi:two-component system chemotaxis response regulator CheY